MTHAKCQLLSIKFRVLIGHGVCAASASRPIRCHAFLRQVVRPPGLSVHRGTADEADGFLREGQADEQRAGPARPRENNFYFLQRYEPINRRLKAKKRNKQ